MLPDLLHILPLFIFHICRKRDYHIHQKFAMVSLYKNRRKISGSLLFTADALQEHFTASMGFCRGDSRIARNRAFSST